MNENDLNRKKRKKKRGKISKFFVIFFFIIVFLASIGAVLYPMISNLYSDQMQSKIQTSYEEKIKEIDISDLESELTVAQTYNKRLLGIISVFEDGMLEAAVDYHNILNVAGNGIMAYIDIPIINVYLPIYHGDDSTSLEKGVEHLLGTSLPVGGTGTHAALSAHTGLSSERMFTDLEELEIGDVFYIHVLNEILAYKVDDINVVDPYDTSLLVIDPDEDYVTLITCTPYAINTHRLLVRGTRIPYEEAKVIEEEIAETKTVESNWEQQYIKGIICGFAAAVLLISFYFFITFFVAVIKRSKGPFDINKVKVKELKILPKMNHKKALTIVRYRKENGSFTSLEELNNIPGLKKNVVNKIRKHLTVGDLKDAKK